jgi:hypothetical protein
LRSGGLNEILEMSYWRLISILETLDENTPSDNGGSKVQNYLRPSQKEMIRKRKEQRKKEFGIK